MQNLREGRFFRDECEILATTGESTGLPPLTEPLEYSSRLARIRVLTANDTGLLQDAEPSLDDSGWDTFCRTL